MLKLKLKYFWFNLRYPVRFTNPVTWLIKFNEYLAYKNKILKK